MENLGKKLGHIVIPLATPFKDGSQDVDYTAAAELTNYVIEQNHCDSLIIGGTSGEFNAMSLEERLELFRVVKEAAAGRVPLVAGACSSETRQAIRLTQEAEKLGFDAAMVLGPCYCKPNQEGAFLHYSAIAEATSLPIMLYNIPIFQGFNLEKETLGRLAEAHSNIVAIKDEAGINPTQMSDFTHVTPDDFTIYNGDDIMVLCGLAQGAAGVVSGGSIILGKMMRTMIDAFLAGDVNGARKIHMDMDPLFKAFGSNGRINPIPLWKAAMNLCGLNVGVPRLPLAPATPEEIEIMRSHLVRLGLI
ncbi:4-hydroxy-tetrahydrodipicolinate synthase [Tichowtungia aerotolerans]|uniref:4-hydroxy-tetrahydrodipicolinate synthase n=1 Tax=Tichowtungia aerotolerans TaxID=2697043 RepID=A0A6P1M7K5_9BACT|nr:4-hydroxy-tetrahydrodipicolinate synthase [Tichowtungia aerotolerans]QHI68534.1 4-hydroxy-tetrahydrodipicolinate synthase [Tichowtungia aerotolerans]